MLKIPEGATHAAADGRFYKLEGEWFYSNYMGHWKRHWSGEPEGAYLLSPATRPIWNGPQDGLPPVGTACEVDHAGKWVECEVIAHFQNENAPVAVFTFSPYTDKPKVRDCAYYFRHAFRPIRTAEQLAAEEHRAQYMPQLIKLWDADTKRTEFLEAVYALIVEAGKS